jgi:putative ABC transport system substrate-binding protein
VGDELNNRRKLVRALGAGVLALPFGSFAQQPGKVWRIGYLGAATRAGFATRVAEMHKALGELGYIEGKNVIFEERWTDNNNDRLLLLAEDLVRVKCDVIVTSGTPGTLALKQATTTIPIVMATSGDAVKSGLVASLARPGGNVTGLSFFAPELYAKRIELIKEAVPRVKTIAYLVNPDNPFEQGNVLIVERAARQLRTNLYWFATRGVNDFETAFSAMAKKRVDAVLVTNDTLLTSNYKTIAALVAKQRLPSIGAAEIAEAGCLLGFGASSADLFRRSATYVDKILRGANPGDLPVEQPTTFELVLNMGAAKALGIKIPDSILVRATKVIE